MPLNANAPRLIRENLAAYACGKKVHAVPIGSLTNKQLAVVNEYQRERGFEELNGEIVFHGKHIYDGRVDEDGYNFDDIVKMIENVLAEDSAVIRGARKRTLMKATNPREDGYGNRVRELAVLECTSRPPRIELYTVYPKGDANKPKNVGQNEKGCVAAAPSDLI